MYNLIRFLIRYHLFFFFLLLEGFCFYLIYQNNQFNHASMVNMSNEASGRLYQTYSGVTDYLYLKRYADSLSRENATLRAQLMDSRSDNTIDSTRKNDTLPRKIEQVYTYTTAKVIRNSVNQSSNYIYINRGRLQGITPQMGVIDPSGVVGQVVNVSDNYAAVMSLLNKKFQVSVKLKGSNYFGPLSWEGTNTTLAKVKEIPKHVKIKVGDTLVTSGYSELFPENVMVGTVKHFNAEPEENFLDIDVALSTNMSNLSYVYVVTNLKRNEIQLLDSLTKNK